MASGDARCVLKTMRNHMLHAARRVVERHGLNPGMVTKEVTTTGRAPLGATILGGARPSFTPGGGDHIVHDAKPDIRP